MASSSSASVSAVIAAPLERTFDIQTPLTPVGFYPKSGPLPAVIEVRDQTGAWDGPGQTRQLMLSDGGWVIEHTVEVDRPNSFIYELSDFQKLFGKLVSGARAEWIFTAVDGGTRIDWKYTFHAYPRAGLLLAGIVKFLWGPYMKKVIAGLKTEIEKQAAAE